MEELTLRQMQEGALNILKKLDGICREQGLRYFLFYGTLIGAIRHKGFIPWDDDLDVAMPRPDFDKLVAYCRRHREELQPMQLMTVDDNPQPGEVPGHPGLRPGTVCGHLSAGRLR